MRKQLEIWCLLHLCVHSRLCFCNHQLRRTLDVQGLFLSYLYKRILLSFFFNVCACMGLCILHVRCRKRPECLRSPGTEVVVTSALLDWKLAKPRPALSESSELSSLLLASLQHLGLFVHYIGFHPSCCFWILLN